MYDRAFSTVRTPRSPICWIYAGSFISKKMNSASSVPTSLKHNLRVSIIDIEGFCPTLHRLMTAAGATSCAAGIVTAVVVGSDDWLGSVASFINRQYVSLGWRPLA